MSTLNNESIWVDDVYQIQEDTPVLGGPGGPDNRQAQQLANRTQYLKDLFSSIPDFRDYTFYITNDDPDGTIAGLSATPEGQLFRVAQGMDGIPAFIYYRKNNGLAEIVATLGNSNMFTKDDYQKAVLQFNNLNWADLPFSITGDDFIPIIAVKSNGLAHVVTDELPGVDLLHHKYRYGVFDPETGDLLQGYTWDGGSAIGGARILDAEFRLVWADESGNVVFGVRWDGTFYPASGDANTDIVLFTKGIEGQRRIWAWMGGLPYQLTNAGDCWSPRVTDSNSLKWLTTSKGGVVEEVSSRPTSQVATFVQRLMHILSYGQSLSTGNGSAPVNTLPHCANRLLTIQQGVMGASQATVITRDAVVPLRPLATVYREVPVVAMSINLQDAERLPVDVGVVASVHGQGGQSVAQLERGTVFYSNLITAVTYAKPYVEDLGKEYIVPFVDWIQGEADRNLAAGEYTAQLATLRSHLDADIRAITGSTSALPMLIDQISNFTAYNLVTSNVPLEQLQMSLNSPTLFYCAGPKYWLPTVEDGVHLTAESSQRLGCMHSRAAGELLAGNPWLPTYCTSAVRKGKSITLSFHTPTPPLVLDMNSVSNPGNYGIRWIDDSTSASVISVTVNGNNTVTVILNNEPTGLNPKIGIADSGIAGQPGGPFTGARSNLRDSATDRDILGTLFYNWACHQQITVTTEA